MTKELIVKESGRGVVLTFDTFVVTISQKPQPAVKPTQKPKPTQKAV